ncbi:MAG: NADH-quinone oxidoreductase subunit J [Gemmatimonadetes bacterium]|nr:NADH-quinone oxidoreductase subunit J [Gemmatimonadota bacterium]
MTTVLFYVFAGIAIGAAIGVVISRSPVGSLLFMVTTLAAIAGTFVLMEAHFLAAVQVIVYAGAIMVLFLFVIMLLNLGHEAQRDLKGGAFAVVAAGVGGAMAGMLALQLRGADVAATGAGAEAIAAATAEYGAVGAIARPLYTTYVVPFEITGILLLVAIVGAVVLAKRSDA